SFSSLFFLITYPAYSYIYTLSLHDALPILIDIVIVSFLIYQLIKIIRGTRINELLNGIFIVLIVKVASSLLNLQTTEYIIDFIRSEEHTSELQSRFDLVCRLLLEKKKLNNI